MSRIFTATFLMAAMAAVLAGCSGSPAAFGITGPGGASGTAGSAPGPQGTAPSSDDAGVQPPGNATDFGNHYAPTIGPAYGSGGHYYGYN